MPRTFALRALSLALLVAASWASPTLALAATGLPTTPPPPPALKVPRTPSVAGSTMPKAPPKAAPVLFVDLRRAPQNLSRATQRIARAENAYHTAMKTEAQAETTSAHAQGAVNTARASEHETVGTMLNELQEKGTVSPPTRAAVQAAHAAVPQREAERDAAKRAESDARTATWVANHRVDNARERQAIAKDLSEVNDVVTGPRPEGWEHVAKVHLSSAADRIYERGDNRVRTAKHDIRAAKEDLKNADEWERIGDPESVRDAQALRAKAEKTLVEAPRLIANGKRAMKLALKLGAKPPSRAP